MLMMTPRSLAGAKSIAGLHDEITALRGEIQELLRQNSQQ
jgi:voltage-gated potassium channel